MPTRSRAHTLATVFAAVAAHLPAAKTQVYLLLGQSNMVGRGDGSALTPEELARLTAVAPRVSLFFRGTDPNDENHWTIRSDGLHPLGPTAAETQTKELFNISTYFGPELFFGLTMAEAQPSANILLVKVAFPGASLVASFNPDWQQSDGQDMLHNVQPECVVDPSLFSWCTESFYATAMADLKAQVARLGADNCKVAGVLSVQGEKESRIGGYAVEAYGVVLTNLVKALRRDTAQPELPFLMVETWISRKSGIVIDEMKTVAGALPNVHLLHDERQDEASVENLPRWPFNFRHFDTEGQRRLGTRFANALLEMRPPVTAHAGAALVAQTHDEARMWSRSRRTRRREKS